MKIRTTADRHIADARSLGGGEKWFPKTPAGKRQAQAHLRKVQAEHERLGAYTPTQRRRQSSLMPCATTSLMRKQE